MVIVGYLVGMELGKGYIVDFGVGIVIKLNLGL